MEWVLGIAIFIVWRLLVRSHRRAVAGIVRQPRVRQIVTLTMPPFDDCPPRTLAEVVAWLPPSIAPDFDCVRGPHEWLTVTVEPETIRSFEGREWQTAATRTFCKHCSATRRPMEVS